jgi:hypothetical protein
MGDIKNGYNILVRKPKGKRPLGRPRHRSQEKFKMYFEEIGCGSVDFIHLAQDRAWW